MGSRGVDLPALATRLGSIRDSAIIADSQEASHTDIPAFLKAEREEAILGLLEETKRETVERLQTRHWEAVSKEWELDKQRILSAVSGGGGADMAELSLAREVSTVSRLHDTTLSGASCLSHTELLYARTVVTYNTAVAGGGVRPDLLADFAGLFSEEKDQEVFQVWEMASCMSSLPKDRPSAAVVLRARASLETSYSKFLRRTVFDNLGSAELGGVPGTYHLVRSFLKIRVPANTPGLDDYTVDDVPVWAMLYYCLRCGDLSAAVQAARKAGPGLADVASLLQELSSSTDRRLSPQTEGAARLHYRRSVRQSTDPYKRAVYCVVAACDPSEEHPEVARITQYHSVG